MLSGPPQLVQTFLIHPYVVPELVQNSHPDLADEICEVRGVPAQGEPEHRDAVGQDPAVVASLRERYALVQAQQVRPPRSLVLDEDDDVGEAEAVREAVESLGDQLLEELEGDRLHQSGPTRRGSRGASATGWGARAS